jgi:GT2 family glycosyltransferase
VRTKILEIDLATAHDDVGGLDGYPSALVLVRWHGRTVGAVDLPVADGRIARAAVRRAAQAAYGRTLAGLQVADALGLATPTASTTLPSATVVVCTRDRPADLARALASLRAACPSDVGVLVVDNAPSDDRARHVAAEHGAAYVLEPRPGQAWARTRGIELADTELVLFTDDDVVVDAGWVDALRRPFADRDVAAVTGLVMPFELETDAQHWFERHYGFSARGWIRREVDATTVSPLAAGTVGAGASMAFRRQIARSLGAFTTELGPGTAASAGDDTYALYRLLSHGHVIVYEPDAIAWHRHRVDDASLRRQVRGYGTATACLLLRWLVDHGEGDALSVAWWHARRYFAPRLWTSLRGAPDAPPLALTLAELRGWLAGPRAFAVTRRRERARLHENTTGALPAT